VQKIPTLFKRDPEDMRQVLPEIIPGCEWVLAGDGVPTRKYDGTCCMLDEHGEWWARREVKPDKQTPPNFQASEHDETTGKTVGWIPMHDSDFKKWHAEAIENSKLLSGAVFPFLPGTYELCGPKVNGNPEGFENHRLVSHDGAEVINLERLSFPMNMAYAHGAFEMLLVTMLPYEGIVWHHPDGRMAKLKRRDFPQS